MPPQIVTITDPASGSQARVLPAMGFNCFSFQVIAEKRRIETLWAAEDFDRGTAKASGSGIPLMFPFAGRIRGTSFRYENREYPLVAGDGQGNAIHGFVINRPWRVTKHAENQVVGQFQASVDEPMILKHWPADFRITADYIVTSNKLVSEFTIENPDTKPLPFGFGTHPYFAIPLGGSDADDCVVKVPVENQWELQGLLPTGQISSPREAVELTRGMPAGQMHFDSVFSGLKFDNHRCETSIHDPRSKRTMTMTFDDQFAAVVLYNPPHRKAVCIEPYTTIPDAFALKEKRIDPKLQVLAPGKSFRTRIEISLE